MKRNLLLEAYQQVVGVSVVPGEDMVIPDENECGCGCIYEECIELLNSLASQPNRDDNTQVLEGVKSILQGLLPESPNSDMMTGQGAESASEAPQLPQDSIVEKYFS